MESKNEINPKKINQVKEMAEKIRKSKTLFIADIKSLPSRQFQEIRKKLRGKADIKIARSNIIRRAIDEASVGAKSLEPYIKEDTAVLFSKLDPFELSSILAENRTSAHAKEGDIAPENIEVEAGPTELVPGPVISELGALGIKMMVEDGKITIRENKIIVKAGDKVTSTAASFMQKLDIKPLKVGFEPVAAYDNQEKMLYTELRIDKEGTLKLLKDSHARAVSFAVKIAYPCKDTIGMLLRKASLEFNKLNSLIKGERNFKIKGEN